MRANLAVLIMASLCAGHVQAVCEMTHDVCEIWLEVESFLTMMDNNVAVYANGGKLYHFNVTNTTEAIPIDSGRVISADGWESQRVVIAVNKTIPGPAIEVYEGQTVLVHVKNKLLSSGVSIHWHGLHQKGTPWSDGVGFITQKYIEPAFIFNSFGLKNYRMLVDPRESIRQLPDTGIGITVNEALTRVNINIIQVFVKDTFVCPILPGQEFTYRFVADPMGTFWYHAHTGTQLSMGLLGPFIVRERRPLVMEEFNMVLQDWNHNMDSDLIYYKMLYGSYENRVKLQATGSLEGAKFSMFPFQSGLINGKGRHFMSDGSYTQSPLTVFTVSQSKLYRFRVIAAGNLYPFRVSIDEHSLKLVSTDGNEIEPKVVESFIINPGERYDFVVGANQNVSSYWIRAETLEVNVTNHIALAIFRYTNASHKDPETARMKCTHVDRCYVANCPFTFYPERENVTCINLDKFTSAENKTVPGVEKDADDIEEIFLNFAFPGRTETPGSTNGRHFKLPGTVALTQMDEVKTFCKEDECGEDKICKCTYSIDLKHNRVYQLVFVNMGIGKGWAHPIHLHGHSFQVLKMGYPHYDHKTGKVLQDNLDVDCRGNPDRNQSFCNSATWTNRSWGGNNIPGLQLKSPPIKDTIIVPTGGYVVVRFKADNPGVWLAHCHIELHNMDGMALMFNEARELQPKAPKGFPTCGDFIYTEEKENSNTDKTLTIVSASLGSVIAILVIVILYLIKKQKIAHINRSPNYTEMR